MSLNYKKLSQCITLVSIVKETGALCNQYLEIMLYHLLRLYVVNTKGCIFIASLYKPVWNQECHSDSVTLLEGICVNSFILMSVIIAYRIIYI